MSKMSYEQELALHMIDFMLFLTKKSMEKALDAQKKAELEADKREMTRLKTQINLNQQDAIDHCIERYGPIIKFAIDSEIGFN